MTDAPEKIWAYTQDKTRCGIWRSDDDRAVSVEYVRADVADTLRAEVARLREALEYAKTEMTVAYQFIEGEFSDSEIELSQHIADAHAGLHVAMHTAAIALSSALQAHGEPDA